MSTLPPLSASFWSLTLALCCALPGVARAELPRLTVKDAVELALRRHPSLRVATEGTEAARARVGQAEAGYLPRVFAGAQWLGGTINGNATSFIGFPDMPRIAGSKPNKNASDYALWGNYLVGLSTGVPIYDFGRTGGRVGEARFNVREQEAGERLARERVVFGVRRAYFATLLASGTVKVAEESVERLAKYAAQAAAMVKQGIRRPIEVSRTQAEVARAQVRLVSARNELAVSRVVLDNAIGVRTEGRLELVPDLTEERFTAALPALLTLALDGRPELAEVKERLQSFRSRLDSVKGNYLPILSATASVNMRGVGGVGNYLNYDAGMLLTWPLFEGNLYKKQEEELYARLRGLDAGAQELLQRIELEVRAAFAQAKSSEEFKRAAQVAFTHARENLNLAQESYNRGLTTVVELADAAELFLVSQINVVRSGYELKIALAAVERAVGQPVPASGP